MKELLELAQVIGPVGIFGYLVIDRILKYQSTRNGNDPTKRTEMARAEQTQAIVSELRVQTEESKRQTEAIGKMGDRLNTFYENFAAHCARMEPK
jgi:uncharacterized FlaG/YvyC family protein